MLKLRRPLVAIHRDTPASPATQSQAVVVGFALIFAVVTGRQLIRATTDILIIQLIVHHHLE
jgi:hypothetical protein